MTPEELYKLIEDTHHIELTERERTLLWIAYGLGAMDGSRKYVEFVTWVRDAEGEDLLNESYDKAVELIGEPEPSEGGDEL